MKLDPKQLRAEADAHAEPPVDAVEQAVQRVAEVTSGRFLGADPVPIWIEAAVGNPHTYDAPDATRRAVCMRILPGTYKRLLALIWQMWSPRKRRTALPP